MAGREVREYTNLTDPKDKKRGKGKDKIDDEEIAFHRMVSKMQDVTGERGGYLHGRGVLKMQPSTVMTCSISRNRLEAEEDAERLLHRTEKRAFQAFKKAVANSSPASLPMPLRVEPKPKSGIRQQDLLKRVVEVKSKKPKVSNPSNGNNFPILPSRPVMPIGKSGADKEEIKPLSARTSEAGDRKIDNPVKSLLSVYDSSDND